ncbi:MAG: type II CAAX endopeptidase family protein [Verrucomicrobiota bacterium]
MLNTDSPKRFWLALGPALSIPAVAAFVYFLTDIPPAAAQSFYAGAKIFLVVWPVIAWLKILPKQQRALPKNPNRAKSAVWGLISGALIVGAIVVVMQTPIADQVNAIKPLIEEKGEQLGFLNYFIPFALIMSLIHSALEEYYWRGFVAGRLATAMKPVVAHLIAAAGFAAHHYIVVYVYFPESPILFLFFGTCVGIGGFIWSEIYQRTG